MQLNHDFFLFRFCFQGKILEKVGGIDGTADGMSTLKSIVSYIINPGFWSQISWTGRGKKDEKKIPLRRYVHLVNFVSVLCFKADETLTKKEVRRLFTYSLLKHAPKTDEDASKDSDKSKTASSAAPTPSSSTLSASSSPERLPPSTFPTTDSLQTSENNMQMLMNPATFPQNMKPMQTMQAMQHIQPMGQQYYNMQPYPWNPYR